MFARRHFAQKRDDLCVGAVKNLVQFLSAHHVSQIATIFEIAAELGRLMSGRRLTINIQRKRECGLRVVSFE